MILISDCDDTDDTCSSQLWQCPKFIAQNPLHTFPRNFPVDGEAINLLPTYWQQVVVMEFGNDTTQRTSARANLLRTCRLCCGLVADYWCNGFRALIGRAAVLTELWWNNTSVWCQHYREYTLHSLMLLLAAAVCDLPTGTVSLCLAVDLARTAVGRSTMPARQSETRCLMNLEILTVLIVLNGSWKSL